MSEWHPIETAPQDKNILLWGAQTGGQCHVRIEGRLVTTGYWDIYDEAWCVTGATCDGPFIDPSHWMPLPAPPNAEAGK